MNTVIREIGPPFLPFKNK